MKEQFLEAYDLYADALYRHCYFRVFSRTRAEDTVQETFMKTWQYITQGNTIDNLRAFLYRVANNVIIDASRKKKEESLDQLMEASDAFEPGYAGHQEIEHGMQMKEILAAIQTLPEEERTLLTLRYVDDLDPRDIAQVLNITPNNASVKLHRATKILKEKLHL